MNPLRTFREILKIKIKLLLDRGIFRSFAQNGEDAVIHTLTKNIKNGFYVDVGGFHPVHYSNTYALYLRGWKGIVIEPNPRAKPLFAWLRPRDEFVQAGVGSKSGDLAYYSFSDPAYNTFSTAQADDLKGNSYVKLSGTWRVPTLPLRDILAEKKVTKIDVMSVDVEGLDLEVLQSHDWNMSPGVVVVESDAFDPDMPEKDPVYAFMKSKDYRLIAQANFSLIFEYSKR